MDTMRIMNRALAMFLALVFYGSANSQTAAHVGKEEFGLTPKQLVQSVEKVEAEIAKCMRTQGFAYVAVDYETVRKGMNADKTLPGVSEEDFVSKYGFGITTTYTGQPMQLVAGYSPGRIGLGERNISIFKGLSAVSQVAYNRALFGENPEATFAIALERENFSRVGGCTREAVKQVFTVEQMSASYYNPKDALVNKDSRMKAALRKYALEIRKSGYDYSHPDEVEPDVLKRLNVLTKGGTIPVDKMMAEQLEALKALQNFERRVAVKNFELAEKLIKPVEERIEREIFATGVK